MLQAQGFIPEVNSLEEILRSSSKKEPELIGYDETPSVMIDQADDGFGTVNGPESSGVDLDPRVHREVDNSQPVRITRISKTLISSSGAAEEQLKPGMAFDGHDNSPADLQSSGRYRSIFLEGYYYVSNYFLMQSGLFRSVGQNNGQITSV